MWRGQYCIKVSAFFYHQGIWSDILHNVGSDLACIGNTWTLLLQEIRFIYMQHIWADV